MNKYINQLKGFSKGVLYNLKGWRTNRKIVVIESDDWGGERTPTKSVYDNLLHKGLKVDLCPFSKFDSLESSSDLEALFKVLSKTRDKHGRPAVFTANFNLANPDFNKIKESKFSEYSYIEYRAVLNKYGRNGNVLDSIRQGIDAGVFFPQNHSREHISTHIWLEELKNGNKGLLLGFDHEVYGLSRVTSNDIKKYHLASQLFRDEKEKEYVAKAMEDSVKLFNELFGFKPLSFIAPVYTWNRENEIMMRQNGIKLIQSSHFQNKFEVAASNSLTRTFRVLGETNSDNQIYLVRNCVFEPAITPQNNNVTQCLKEINMAFIMNKPAIISTHRLNYIGSLSEVNRTSNLKMLNELLTGIKKMWPDVEFMSNVELGKIIANEKGITI